MTEWLNSLNQAEGFALVAGFLVLYFGISGLFIKNGRLESRIEELESRIDELEANQEDVDEDEDDDW